MCDIGASRKSLSVVLLKLIWFAIGINAQANVPQFYPNPAYNPKTNLQNLNGYGVSQTNPQFGGAGVLYQVDDRQNPQGYVPPNFVYREPKAGRSFDNGENTLNNVNNPQSFPEQVGQISQIPGQRPQNTGQIPRSDNGQIPLNPGQIGYDENFNSRNNRFNGDIRRLLQDLDGQASQQCTSNVAAQWNFETNVNEATQAEAVSKLS